MRLHVFSDLHLEFGPLDLPPAVRNGALAELVLLAGDIHTDRRGARWAARSFHQPVGMVFGNHEAYGDSLTAAIAAERDHASEVSAGRAHPVRVLERETWMLTAHDGTPVRVVAATLWTDYALFGETSQSERMDDAHWRMNDFQTIRIRGHHGTRPLLPADVLHLHREGIAYIETELTKPFDGISIVMTHHAPSARSVPENRLHDPITAAYASNLDALIERTQPELWVHGHVHSSADYRIGTTRVVCNPRGYFPTGLNDDFDPALVVEI